MFDRPSALVLQDAWHSHVDESDFLPFRLDGNGQGPHMLYTNGDGYHFHTYNVAVHDQNKDVFFLGGHDWVNYNVKALGGVCAGVPFGAPGTDLCLEAHPSLEPKQE